MNEILAIATPFIAIPIIQMAGRIGDRVRSAVAVIAGLLTAYFTLSLVGDALTGKAGLVEYSWIPTVNISLGFFPDALGVMMACIAGVVGSLVLIYSTQFMKGEKGLSRYYYLTVLFIGGMIGVALTDNLIALYFFWEIIGLCSYALISFWYEDPVAARAGMKAFIMTRFGDVGLLAGVLILFLATGSLSISHSLSSLSGIPEDVLVVIGALLLLAAIGKSAQVPLHTWLPDAMEAPTTITALIHAACLVNAGVYLVARFRPIFELSGLLPAVLWIGCITAFLAASLALVERDLKRVLAYSTISQLGYMMASLGMIGGFVAGVFHLFNHSLFKALLFLCAGSVIYAVGKKHIDMYEVRGLGRRMPVTSTCFLIGILALSGIPPFNGFWSKDMILSSALHENIYALTILLITAIFTFAYSFRMYILVFRGEPKIDVKESPAAMTSVLMILSMAAILSWIGVGPLTRGIGFYIPSPSITLSELLSEAMNPSALLMSATIILAGSVAVVRRGEIYEFLENRVPQLISVLRNAFFFDAAYEEIVRGFYGFSRHFRRTHTGDLNYNLIGIVIGFLLLVITFGGVP